MASAEASSTIGAPTSLPGAHRGLRREIGFIGLLWASGGSIIGSGWLFSSQEALAAAGPAAVISWGIAALAIMLLALVHAELGAMWPVAGGTGRFPHTAFGGAGGASFGWFSFLQAATVAPIEVLAVITYAQHYSWAKHWMKVSGGQNVLTGTGLAISIGLMAVFTLVNFLAVRRLAQANSALTWWKVTIPVVTIVALLVTAFHGSNFSAANGFAPDGAAGVLGAISTSGIIFALLGFEQADQLAGEAANPRRDIPRAVIGSIVIGATIYILLQIAFIGAVVSPGGTGLIYTTATSRVSYGLSKNRYFPRVYESTTGRGIPWFGLITSFIVGCICFLPFPSWQSLVGLITSASVLMYAGAPLALGVFRRRLPDADRPYRVPAAHIMAPLAFVVSGLIILWSGWDTDWKLGIAILLGYLILGLTRVFSLNSHNPLMQWRSAQWLPVYLVGLGVVVYPSPYGALTNPVIPLWWGIAAIAVFSLVIYYWEPEVALPG